MHKNISIIKNIAASLCAALALTLLWGNSAYATVGSEKSVDAEGAERIGGGYALTGQSASVGYRAEVYDETNGLITSDANYILGATDGYIWIGSYSGIFRYDGTVFEKIDYSEGLTSGRGLFEDRKGRIWVGTNDNGVVVIDGDATSWLTYKDRLPSSIPCPLILW